MADNAHKVCEDIRDLAEKLGLPPSDLLELLVKLAKAERTGKAERAECQSCNGTGIVWVVDHAAEECPQCTPPHTALDEDDGWDTK